MRPVKLTMQAFGSYADRVTIDFTKPRQNLFLISGNTGSGKSTIFDAIVFALYGDTSSRMLQRSSKSLRSQFADPKVPSYVELTFSSREGGQDLLYTVNRTPAYTPRGKKTERQEGVTLTLPDGSVYPEKKKGTDKKLGDIVNLTKDQFLQVAMIAQGDFVRLLRSTSDEKQKIFRKLFKTEIYESIDNRLKEKVKQAHDVCAASQAGCMAALNGIRIPEDCPLTPELEAVRARMNSARDLCGTQDLDTMAELLTQMQQDLAEENERVKVRFDAARKDRDTRFKAEADGQTLVGHFTRLEEARAQLEQCAAEAADVEAAEVLARQISAAYSLRVIFGRYRDAVTGHDKTEKDLTGEQQALPGLRRKAEAAAHAEQQAYQEDTAKSRDLAALDQSVTKAMGVFDAMDTARDALAEKQAVQEKARMEAEAAASALRSMEARIQEKQQRWEALSDAPLRYNQWENDRKEAEVLSADLRELEERLSKIRQQEEQLRQQLAAYRTLQIRYREKDREFQNLRDAYYDAQAGFLAKDKLVEGKPCPVCGSVLHPAPCPLPEDLRDLTRDQVEDLEAQAKALYDAYSGAEAEAAAQSEILETGKEQASDSRRKLLSKLREILPDVPENSDLSRIGRAVSLRKTQLQSRGESIRGELAERDGIRRFLDRADSSLDSLRKAREDSQEAVRQAEKDVTAANTTLRNLLEQKTWPSRQEAAEALSAQKDLADAAHQAYLAAKAAHEEASRLEQRCANHIRTCLEDLPQQEQSVADRQEEYQTALMEEGLTQETWQTLTADYPKSRVQALQTRVQEFSRRRSTAEGARASAEQAIDSRPRPDLENLHEAFREADGVYQKYQSQLGLLSGICHGNRANLESFRNHLARYKVQYRDFSRINFLYESLHGSNTRNHMDIETYVQRYYLQQILRAANRRFFDMSGGQFELRMASPETTGKGISHGLDLIVYSTVTGQEREANTLSGGESFMAALSLALGMADQIQQNAVDLDMMFLDEGFGSLDSQAREQAVRVLQNMAGGSKLIGIISHVTELKQAIDDQLLVTKDRSGSHVTWDPD